MANINDIKTSSAVRRALYRMRFRVGLSRSALVLEHAARAFWPVWTLGFVSYALAAFELHASLTRPQLNGALTALVIMALGFIGLGIFRFRWPSRADAVARLDDATADRPVSALEDTQATFQEDPAARLLWQRHLEQMAQRAEAAPVVAPDLKLADKDPWALRLIGVTALIAAAIFAGGEGLSDLTTPGTTAETSIAQGPSFEAWAAPPAYTGKPVIYLPEIAQGERVRLPEGTEISVRIYGDESAYDLSETVSAAEDGSLTQSAAGIAEATIIAKKAGSLVIRRSGDDLATWTFVVNDDMPPGIGLNEPLTRTTAGEMELHFTAQDDYGVVGAEVLLDLDIDSLDRRHGLVVDPVPREAIRLDLPMPFSGSTTAIEEVLVENLSKHPWAGLPVRVTLTAHDASGQSGHEGPQVMELPGRRFFDPLAAAIVEQRRDLLWSPDNAPRVEQLLKAVTHKPEGVFRSQKAYLVTRAALRRLGYSREDGLTQAEVEDIAEFLWQAAVLIEDGDLASAAERLRQAQDRLEDAIRNGATDDEIAKLMQELREAMDEYMRQMARDAMENGQQMEQAQTPEGQQMNGDQLQEMLDEIERLMQEGNMAEAQQLLEMLRQMMENMRMAQQQGQGQQGQGQQMMQDLQESLRQQQQLSDESFQEMQRQFQEQRNQGRQQQLGQQGQGQQQQGQQPGQGQGNQPGQQQNGQGGQQQDQSQGQPDQSGSPTAQQLAQRQEALRGMLNSLREQMPGPGSEAGRAARDSLERAERSMGEARDNLDQGDLPGALDNQADAMDALRDGIQNLGEELRQQAQQQDGGGQNPLGQLSDGENSLTQDPLGRPNGANGMIQTDDQLLPGEEALRRSRELLDEIRRRAGDPSRPQAERDYLRRLLERF